MLGKQEREKKRTYLFYKYIFQVMCFITLKARKKKKKDVYGQPFQKISAYLEELVEEKKS